jgi:transposase
MRTKTEYPSWVLAQKRTGTEIKYINGHYYLYEIKGQWDKIKKRSVKRSIKLLGKISPEGLQANKNAIPTKVRKRIWQVEYGFVHFMQHHLQDSIKHLQTHFPTTWQTIVGMSFCRFVYQTPLKNMEFRFVHSYLSELYPNIDLHKDTLTGFMRVLGEEREAIRAYFNAFWQSDKQMVLFDASSFVSLSKKMETFPKTGYNAHHSYDPQLNLMFVHSVEMRMPLYYRLLPGNVREVKAFALCLKEFSQTNITVITDKGFYSKENILLMQQEGICYISPLKRNNTLILYTKIVKNEPLDGFFEFENRIIWYYSIKIENQNLYIFSDDVLKTQEKKDFLLRIQNENKGYSLEKYYEKLPTFGTISLLTNGNMAAQDVFLAYKSRNDIEVLFDAYKNILHADRTYMQNDIALETWLFINFIAMQWYYITYNLLKKYNLNKSFSPTDLMDRLTEIKKINIDNQWHNAEITKGTIKLLKKLQIPIP